MAAASGERAVRPTAWAVTAFYLLVVLEFFYMASPFAAYFYSAYLPGLEALDRHAGTAWLTTFFLPHFAPSSSALVQVLPAAGIALTVAGLLGFLVGAAQVYARKLRRRGAATGGLYRFVRHPQYAGLMLAGAGMLLLWPRHLMVILFVTMLFAYRGLAWLEERECLRRFGDAYSEYQARTPRFLPWPWRSVERPRAWPASGPARVLAAVLAYAVTLAVALGAAAALQRYTIRHLVIHYADADAWVALAPIEGTPLPALAARAAGDPRVAARLDAARAEGARLVNYVMPWEWAVPEIPMNGATDHLHPAAREPGRYKVIFTRARGHAAPRAPGPDLVRQTTRTEPLLEAWLDAEGRVARLLDPPARPFYGAVPVPIY